MKQINDLGPIGQKLVAAGFVPKPTPTERLAEVALEAAKKYPAGNFEAQISALFSSIRDDADLLWEIFKPEWRVAAARPLLTAANASLRDKQRDSEGLPAGSPLQPMTTLPADPRNPLADGRRFIGDTQDTPASDQPSPSAGGGHVRHDVHGSFAAAAPKPVRSVPDIQRPRATFAQQRTGLASVAAAAAIRRGVMATLTIQGRRLYEATGDEIKRAGDARGADSAFLAEQASRVPANEPAGKYIRDDGADALYRHLKASYVA